MKTHLFHLKFDSSLWDLLQVELKDVYDFDTQARISKLSDKAKVLKQKLETCSETEVQLLAEIPSIKMIERVTLMSEGDSPHYGIGDSERHRCIIEAPRGSWLPGFLKIIL